MDIGPLLRERGGWTSAASPQEDRFFFTFFAPLLLTVLTVSCMQTASQRQEPRTGDSPSRTFGSGGAESRGDDQVGADSSLVVSSSWSLRCVPPVSDTPGTGRGGRVLLLSEDGEGGGAWTRERSHKHRIPGMYVQLKITQVCWKKG
ncbi:hypothetical protein EYF80_040684 [Liparis tanakae]|uniref:Uncharacterized protein n=1 Tax=Liparis tanakae TaxID=230148 RepID=A0A4Z2G6D7_9TELE|nr:hypothetical protein EYF80_040684 [Liparis tanakae]